MAKTKVDIWERLHWECPACCKDNSGPSWLRRGDEVTCSACGCKVVVDEHYADCRPETLEKSKAKL